MLTSTDIYWYQNINPFLLMTLCYFSAWTGVGNKGLIFKSGYCKYQMSVIILLVQMHLTMLTLKIAYNYSFP